MGIVTTWIEHGRRWWTRRVTERQVATWRRRNVGSRSLIDATVQVYGWENVRIGRNSMICDDSLLNAINSPGSEPRILIGDHCLIGRRNFLNAGTKLSLADFCLTGTDCHFLGSDHAHESPFVPYIAAGNAPGGVIILGPNVWLGARVTVLKNVHIGYGSIIGAASVVTRDIPPFAIAAGSPARVLKRFCHRRNAWIPAEEFSAADEADLPREDEFVEKLRQTHPHVRMPTRALGRGCGNC